MTANLSCVPAKLSWVLAKCGGYTSIFVGTLQSSPVSAKFRGDLLILTGGTRQILWMPADFSQRHAILCGNPLNQRVSANFSLAAATFSCIVAKFRGYLLTFRVYLLIVMLNFFGCLLNLPLKLSRIPAKFSWVPTTFSYLPNFCGY